MARVSGHRPRSAGRLLLCTDELWRCLPDAAGLGAAGRGSPLDGARAVVAHSVEAGRHDNVTAVVIPVTGCVADR